jgi:hypothetical protein
MNKIKYIRIHAVEESNHARTLQARFAGGHRTENRRRTLPPIYTLAIACIRKASRRENRRKNTAPLGSRYHAWREEIKRRQLTRVRGRLLLLHTRTQPCAPLLCKTRDQDQARRQEVALVLLWRVVRISNTRRSLVVLRRKSPCMSRKIWITLIHLSPLIC